MFVTKDEALTKWCPMARIVLMNEKADGTVSLSSVSANRVESKGKLRFMASGNCIGEKCMMFMQVPPKKTSGKTKYGTLINHEDLYYCGLQ